MKKLLFILLCCSVECLAQVGNSPKRRFVLPPGITSKDYLPNTVIVKFRDEPLLAGLPLTAGTLPGVKGKIMAARQPFALSSQLQRNSGPAAGELDKIYELKLSPQADLIASINALLADKNVAYAEPSYVYRTGYTPNDPGLAQSPYLNQVRAPQAWDLLKQASGVVIAIIDSGSELTHPDLAPNIWLNTNDPVNGRDDDNDGYIDNYYGWDFAGASTLSQAADNDPNVKSRNSQHGIHVSGLAGAATDNGQGMASIGGAKLMIIKAGPDDNASLISKGYEGIKYAADHGAQIINCSWSGLVGGAYGRDVINYALSKGCLIVAAAGNSNSEQPEYPAAFDGVLAVADVNSSDRKSSTSNYGRHLGIAAPGTAIYSTLYDKTYGLLSGTSMSTPIVASAAALVKTFRPAYSARQVGELLRVTADPLPTVPGYEEKLGNGRLNVFRAMTEHPAAVRIAALRDANPLSNHAAGDTLKLAVDLQNFLQPVSGLVIRLTTTNRSVRILNPELPVGDLATGSIKSAAEAFRIEVLPTISDNEDVEFRLAFAANGGQYQDYQYFTRTFALDYLNYRANEIATTLTSVGRLGFKENTSDKGQGFRYRDRNLLFEASLLVGTAAGKLANNARTTELLADEDFVKTRPAQLVSNDGRLLEAVAAFDDRDASNGPGLVIENRHIAFKDEARSKAVVVNYEVTNPGAASIQDLYLGLFTDWDFGDGAAEVTRFDKATKTAFFEPKTGNYPFIGIKLLNKGLRPLYTPLSASLTGNALSDNSFTREEKLQLLRSGVSSDGMGQNVNGNADVSFVTGYGPVSMGPGARQVFSFVVIAGDSPEEINQTAAAIAQTYSVPGDAPTDQALVLKQNYPNPVTGLTTIEFSLPEAGKTELAVFDLAGKRVAVIADAILEAGSHQFDFKPLNLTAGVYVYRLTTPYGSRSAKMIVMP